MWTMKRQKPPKRPQVNVEKTVVPGVPTLKLLMDLRPLRDRATGPGPSKFLYRVSRIWKKGWVRRGAMIGLPVLLGALSLWSLATNSNVHRFFGDQRASMMAALSAQPEFAISSLRLSGASEDLSYAIAEVVDLPSGASSLSINVADVQRRVSGIAAVKSARVTFGSGGALEISVVERHAAAIWRDGEDLLWLLDREGVAIGRAVSRIGYPDLPLVLGEGADAVVAEALDVFASVPDLQPRVRALVRVGQRRWNVSLDRGLTILLPAEDPSSALSRVMAWHYGDDVLDRDLAAIDMRIADRPTLRMTPEALEVFERQDALNSDEGEET